MAVGVHQRHRQGCRGGRCECSWEAFVYSGRDGKKIRKTFPRQAAARAWRDDTRVAVRRMLVRAPTSVTLARQRGVVHGRPGRHHPHALGRPLQARGDPRLRDRVPPARQAGARRLRLSQVTRGDIQDLVDSLVAKQAKPSTIVVTVSAVRVIYKRALGRGEVAVNPVVGVQLPAVRGRRSRIAEPANVRACSPRCRSVTGRCGPRRCTPGLRRGELMALRISDIDLARGVIHVRRGWDIKAGEITPKSGRERIVPIAATLREHLERHLLSLSWEDGLVFGVGPDTAFQRDAAVQAR